jgi:hypothetical protein
VCQTTKKIGCHHKNNILFINLGTHEVFTEVAYIEDQRGAKSTHLGKVLSNKAAFKKLARQLQSKYPDATLHFLFTKQALVAIGFIACSPALIIAAMSSHLRLSLKNQERKSKPINVMRSNLQSCSSLKI